ncbi:MAG: chemotaxis protein CheA [Acidimicrobiales bacterium]
MSEMDEVVQEFLVESYENLDQLDRDLVSLEDNPSDSDTLGSIFRTVHTIKGTCGFLGFSKLEAVTHAGENLLSALREGELTINPSIASGLLALGDATREMLASVEATGAEGNGDYSELVVRLTALRAGETVSEAVESTPTGVSELVGEITETDTPTGSRLGDILIDEGRVTPQDVELAVTEQSLGDERPIGAILMEHGVAGSEAVGEALQSQAELRGGGGVSEGSIRVDVGLLDGLMNLVGELVLARNQILQLVANEQDNDFHAPAQRLNLITTELQEGVMKTRMQPIGTVWGRFPRVVRDLALSCGKQVRIDMEGAETELDKTIIEAIKDPLTHLVRNSIDHGIESPDDRASIGKPREGRLTMRAFHEGGQVIIEISDDGGGINPIKVRDRAVERSIISADQAARMTERELLNLIFLPGFSTAAAVTNVSGRGVGMDVVKTNIERIGGTVDVHSEISRGTTFKVKIPLTLAIIPALVVTCGGDRYAIPQISLLELLRLEGDQARQGIEFIHGAPVYRLRGRLLPIVDLGDQLRGGTGSEQGVNEDQDVVNVVVLQADDRQFGLIVDDINDTQEIVVKPLGLQVKDVPIFAGATIMGDGLVALILDVLGIAQQSGVVTEARERALLEQSTNLTDLADNRQTLLLVSVGDDRRVAVPLSEVSRLEEFPRTALERSGMHDVVQYREEILPLVHLADVLGMGAYFPTSEEGSAEDEMINVVVYSYRGHSVGLMVGAILDIVEEQLTVGLDGRLPASVVVQGRVTDLIDTNAAVESMQLFDNERAFQAQGV